MSDSLDRSEAATPKHRSQARQRGQVARSTEIFNVAVVFTGLVSLSWIGPILGHNLIRFTQSTFSLLRHSAVEIPLNDIMLSTFSVAIFGAIAVWLGMVLASTLIAGFSQVGFEFANEALTPRWGKLNPVSNIQHFFSWSSLVRLVSALLKLAVLVGVCYGVVRETLNSELLNRQASPMELAAAMLHMIFALGWRIVLGMGVIAVADYVYQRWQHEKNLRMTKEEVREEGKQADMNPQIKGKLRGMMRKAFNQRMMLAVPKATVVITNPTHVAIALRYDRNTMKSPRVVAKGLRLIAEKIKACARENGVPIIENKPLARGLYRQCPLGAEIPVSYYQAVATVLAQVYRMSAKREQAVPPKQSADRKPQQRTSIRPEMPPKPL